MTAGDILFIVSFIILPTAIIVSCIWALVLIRRGVLFANQSSRSAGSSASQAYESGYGPGYVDDDAIAMDTTAYTNDAELMPVEPYTPAPTPASIAPASASAPAAVPTAASPARRVAAPAQTPAPLVPASAPVRAPSMPAPLVRSTAPDAVPPAVPDRTDFTDELPLLPPNATVPAMPVAPVSASTPGPAPAPLVSDAPTWSETGEISTMPSGAYAGEPVAPVPAESANSAARPRRQPGSVGLRPRARRAASDTDSGR